MAHISHVHSSSTYNAGTKYHRHRIPIISLTKKMNTSLIIILNQLLTTPMINQQNITPKKENKGENNHFTYRFAVVLKT